MSKYNDNNKASNIAKQGAILASAGILARFIGFLYRVPLTDMLGDQGNAVYASGYYIYTLFLVVSSAGLPSAISKMVSERTALGKYREAHSIFRVSMVFAFLSGAVSMFILFFFAIPLERFGGVTGSRYAIMTLAPTVFIVSIMSVYRGYFQGMKNTVPTAISQVSEQVLNGVFSIVMCYIILNSAFSTNLVGGSIAGAAAGGTIGTGIGALFGLITIMYIYSKHKKKYFKLAKKDRSKVASPIKLLKELFMIAIPIILGSAVFSLTNIIDMSMIMNRLMYSGAFSSDQAEVLYGQLTGKYLVLTALPISISTSLATASIPAIAEEIALKNKKGANEKINFTVKLTMIISIPAAIGISVLAEPILWCLFPSDSDGALLLMVGGISVIFLSLTQIVGGMLQGISKYYIPVLAAICGALFKIIINYFLVAIPAINVIGAVIGTIVCYMVASIIDCIYIQKITKIKFDIKGSFIKPFVSAVIMGASVLILYKGLYYITQNILSSYSANNVSMFISIITGIIVYFFILLKLDGVNKYEVESMPFGAKISKILFK